MEGFGDTFADPVDILRTGLIEEGKHQDGPRPRGRNAGKPNDQGKKGEPPHVSF